MMALLYGGHTVDVARGLVAVQLDEHVADKLGWTRGLLGDMLKLALLCRMGLQMPQGAGVRAPFKADLTLTPGSGTLVVAGENAGAETVIQNVSQPKLTQQAVNALRQRGVLSQDNLTDVAGDVYQSDTGQLIIKPSEKILSVDTPQCQGATMAQAGQSVRLSGMAIANHGKGVSLLLASLDGKALNQSGRMVLLMATQSVGSGAKFNADFTQSDDWGRLPYLMQPAKVTLTLTGRHGVKPHAWALHANGTRNRELAMQPIGQGNWQMTIDGQAMGRDITPYFEIQMLPKGQ
jgi:hypothetical protein